MSIKLTDTLFNRNLENFKKIEKEATQTLMLLPMFRPIGANLKQFVKKYAEKKDVCLKILYLPFHNEQVWGVFYEKSGVDFIVINSEISLNKQNVALAHEFYHLIISLENENIKPDIILDTGTAGLDSEEDREANAFSSCLLMPSDVISVLIDNKPNDMFELFTYIKFLMDCCVVPYKTAVIRLYELGIINQEDAEIYLSTVDSTIRTKLEQVRFTQLDTRWDKQFGSDFIDLDDLESLITENEANDFIDESKATEIRNNVENIIKQIRGISNDEDSISWCWLYYKN